MKEAVVMDYFEVPLWNSLGTSEETHYKAQGV